MILARRLLLSCLACFTLALPGAWAQDAPPVVAVDISYVLGAGDAVRLDVVGQPELSGERPIESDGAVQVPYAGRVVIGGYTLSGATEQITARLRDGYLKNPQVVLTVTKLGSKMVSVSGGVNKQGEYPFTAATLRISEVIVRSGGLVDPSTPTAQIFRDGPAGRLVIPVDLELIGRGDRAADLELLPRDHVEVPPALQIFVDGHVQKPGTIVFREGMTVTQAVAAAGGASQTALTTRVTLIREERQIPVNLRRIIKGQEADVSLRPGDHVYVPESPI